MNYIDISEVKMNPRLPKIDFNQDDGAYELACSVFDACNLRCKFCFQQHTLQDINIDDIYEIPKYLIEHMLKECQKYNIATINLKMWGGELFYDQIPDSFFSAYLYIYRTFVSGLRAVYPNIVVYTTWLSNGIFTKYERVEKLLENTNGMLGLSYDPVGRFTNKTYEIFYKTLMHFLNTDFRLMASITLTKSNITAYISRDDILIKNIRLLTDISYYTPGDNWQKDTPNDDDIFNFFKWGIDNKLMNIKVIFDIVGCYLQDKWHFMHYCNCAKAAQYQDKNVSKNCVLRASHNIPAERFYGEYTNEVDESNCAEYKNTLGIIKRGCITCEYYQYCQKPCWISVIFDGYKVTNCPFKRVYQYLDTHPKKEEIINEYNFFTNFWEA